MGDKQHVKSRAGSSLFLCSFSSVKAGEPDGDRLRCQIHSKSSAYVSCNELDEVCNQASKTEICSPRRLRRYNVVYSAAKCGAKSRPRRFLDDGLCGLSYVIREVFVVLMTNRKVKSKTGTRSARKEERCGALFGRCHSFVRRL